MSLYDKSITTTNPTPLPSANTTYALTIYTPMTVTTTVTSSATSSADNSTVHVLVNVLKNTVDLMTPILVLFATVTLVASYFYHDSKNKKRGVKFDKIKYISILKFLANIGSIFSQLLFGIVIWIENEIFVLNIALGCVMSLFLLIYFITTAVVSVTFFKFIKHSRGSGCHLITKYKKKHLSLIVVGIIIGGFYETIDMLQSCIAPNMVFNMPLRDSDKKDFMKFKHIHTLLTNAIPQFIFQTIYFVQVDYKNVDQIAVYTFLWGIVSMLLLVVNIFAYKNSSSSAKFISVDSYTSETKVDFKIKIESNSAREYHTHCQETVEKVIDSMMAEYESPANIAGFADMSYNCNVFASEATYQGQKQVDLYYYGECTIKHDDGDPNPAILIDHVKSVPEKLTNVK